VNGLLKVVPIWIGQLHDHAGDSGCGLYPGLEDLFFSGGSLLEASLLSRQASEDQLMQGPPLR
jgi:hypothetical protein